jgi:hypothetical protein
MVKIRGIGRVEYEWTRPGEVSGIEIKSAKLTVDCPSCGVRVQEYHSVHAGSAARY